MENGCHLCTNVGGALKRDEMVRQLDQEWDIVVIGGGATGLGAAVDAAARGYKTVLLEQHDFAKATSSRSTKLIHGGLRYLQQGNVTLVIEALHERGTLCQNAPHLVHHLPFLVPLYKWWEAPFYGIGLKIYDLLAGDLGLEPSKHLTRRQTIRAIPTIEQEGLKGGALYFDGQFDDARLAITLAQTAADLGATIVNYCAVTSLIKKRGVVVGVRATDQETGRSIQLKAKAVINATGVFSDQMRKIDDKKASPIVMASQGVHLVLPASFLPGNTAILVPHTDDKRVIFLVPWHDHVIVGTTDIEVKRPLLEPVASDEEITFLLSHASRYLTKHPQKSDILAVFAGLRPLVKTDDGESSSAVSRDHSILVSKSGLITIAGGKWTTYRKMGEDVVNKAIKVGHLPKRSSITQELHLHGYLKKVDPKNHLSLYGTDIKEIRKIGKENPKMREKLSPQLPYTKAEVVWAVRSEMARSVEDVLARRTRALFLNARAAVEAAPVVAAILAKEMRRSKRWVQQQLKEFQNVAKHYLP